MGRQGCGVGALLGSPLQMKRGSRICGGNLSRASISRPDLGGSAAEDVLIKPWLWSQPGSWDLVLPLPLPKSRQRERKTGSYREPTSHNPEA